MPSYRDRLVQANKATSVAEATYPGFPDPNSPTGWADIPAVVLGVDLTGREDIERSFPLNRQPLTVADAWLGIEPLDGSMWSWLFGVEFDADFPDLEIASMATPEMIDLFCDAQMILIATEAQADDRSCEFFPLIVAPNEPARWQQIQQRPKSIPSRSSSRSRQRRRRGR